MRKSFWLLFALAIAANAQQCTETAPCQQVACQTVSGYCSFCNHTTECDPDGTSGMLDCYQTTTWTDWFFGTTCDSTTNEYCMFDSCTPFISAPQASVKGTHAKTVLARIRRRNAERSKRA